MKTKTSLIILAFLSTNVMAQFPIPLQPVTDVGNKAQLVTIGTIMKKVRDNGNKIAETLKTAQIVKEYAQVSKIITAFEDSYCVLKDLNVTTQLANSKGLLRTGCSNSVAHKFSVLKIENAIESMNMAITSKLLTLADRKKAIENAINNVEEANKDLSKVNEKLQYGLKAKENQEVFVKDIGNIFRALETK